MFCISSFHNLFLVKTTQRTKTTLGGRGGELPSERQTRALAAHMNGIRGDPSTASLSAVANDNGHSGRAVDMSCDAEGWMPAGCTGLRP